MRGQIHPGHNYANRFSFPLKYYNFAAPFANSTNKTTIKYAVYISIQYISLINNKLLETHFGKYTVIIVAKSGNYTLLIFFPL